MWQLLLKFLRKKEINDLRLNASDTINNPILPNLNSPDVGNSASDKKYDPSILVHVLPIKPK